MSKKQDAFYFDNFTACAELSSKAAHQLKKVLTDFNPEKISEQFDEIHEIERKRMRRDTYLRTGLPGLLSLRSSVKIS